MYGDVRIRLNSIKVIYKCLASDFNKCERKLVQTKEKKQKYDYSKNHSPSLEDQLENGSGI